MDCSFIQHTKTVVPDMLAQDMTNVVNPITSQASGSLADLHWVAFHDLQYFGSNKKHLGPRSQFFVHPQFRWRAGHVQGWMYNCSLLQFLEQFEISVSRWWVGPRTSSSSIQQDSSRSYELISLWSEPSVLCCFFLAFFGGSERVKTPRCNPSPSSSEVRNSEKAQPTSKRVEKIIHFLTYQADGAYGAQIFTSQMVTGKIWQNHMGHHGCG